MKRIYYFLTLLTLAAVPMTFASCDDDDPGYWYDDWYDDWRDDNDDYNTPMDIAMAQTLNGSWTGTVVNEFTGDNGQRQQTQCYADFSFVQYTANSTKGNGYETDYVPLYDDNGNPVYENGQQQYEQQTLPFTWYVDQNSYNIYIEYTNSRMLYELNSHNNKHYSGFSLGYDDKTGRDIFSGVMEGRDNYITQNDVVRNDEYVFFDLERVTTNSAKRQAAKAGGKARHLVFGSSTIGRAAGSDMPFAIRRR